MFLTIGLNDGRGFNDRRKKFSVFYDLMHVFALNGLVFQECFSGNMKSRDVFLQNRFCPVKLLVDKVLDGKVDFLCGFLTVVLGT